jgi:hypothetical protein
MIYYCKAYIYDKSCIAVHIQTTPINHEPVEIEETHSKFMFQVDSDAEILASDVIKEICVKNGDVICNGKIIGTIP